MTFNQRVLGSSPAKKTTGPRSRLIIAFILQTLCIQGIAQSNSNQFYDLALTGQEAIYVKSHPNSNERDILIFKMDSSCVAVSSKSDTTVIDASFFDLIIKKTRDIDSGFILKRQPGWSITCTPRLFTMHPEGLPTHYHLYTIFISRDYNLVEITVSSATNLESYTIVDGIFFYGIDLMIDVGRLIESF